MNIIPETARIERLSEYIKVESTTQTNQAETLWIAVEHIATVRDTGSAIEYKPKDGTIDAAAKAKELNEANREVHVTLCNDQLFVLGKEGRRTFLEQWLCVSNAPTLVSTQFAEYKVPGTLEQILTAGNRKADDYVHPFDRVSAEEYCPTCGQVTKERIK